MKRVLGTNAALMIVSVVLILAPGTWAASKYKTLYRFMGGADGAGPYAGVIFDPAGNLYGTTVNGGAFGYGVVFALTPNTNGSWTETPLYSFVGGYDDGASPYGGLIFDPAGALFGTTFDGGYNGGESHVGTVFELTPGSSGVWTEKIVHFFGGGGCNDGAGPYAGLIWDQPGNLYGTTVGCGGSGVGAVVQLSPNPDGSWGETVIHRFGPSDKGGITPYSGLIIDHSGILYGAAAGGGLFGAGVIFRMTPNTDGTWKYKAIHHFSGGKDGANPYDSLIFDPAGNLYGTTANGGAYGYGVVFKLTPNTNGIWRERVLHHFKSGQDGANPYANLVFDATGTLYGTTEKGGNIGCGGGAGCGTVFKLAPNLDGEWSESVLHRFAGHSGAYPCAGLILDGAGNLYGTAFGDSATTFGSVFEIMP